MTLAPKKRRAKLEQPATNLSFDAIRSALVRVAARSTLRSPPVLRYTPKSAQALEVRERGGPSGDAVVVGLDQAPTSAANRPPSTRCWDTKSRTSRFPKRGSKSRRAVALHFRTLGWTIAIFYLVLGFIDRRDIGGRPPFGGFVPVFDGTIYAQLSPQFAVLVLSSAIVFV
jgi:hypothetical protein